MKKNIIIATIITASFSIIACTTIAPTSTTKISKEQAQATALTKTPKGKVKSSELEKENGVMVWSFDINTPGTKNITEVQVDANNGKVVSVETETPAQQAKEAAEDKKKE